MLEIKKFENPATGFEIKGYKVGLTSLLSHLERLNNLEITSKFTYPPTDDHWAQFKYKGYLFSIDSPFSYFWINTNSKDIPKEIYNEVEKHIINYKTVWPIRWIASFIKYFKLPKFNKDD